VLYIAIEKAFDKFPFQRLISKISDTIIDEREYMGVIRCGRMLQVEFLKAVCWAHFCS